MKFGIFLVHVLRLPSRASGRRPTCAVLFFLLTAAFSVSAGTIVNVNAQAVENVRQLIKEAKKLTRRGDLIDAEKIARRALETNQQDADAKLNLAYILIKQRRFAEAYDLSYDVARSDPKNSFALAVLGSTLLNVGDFKNARTTLVAALQINDGNALAWAGLGTLNFYENRVFLGLGQLQTAVSIEPSEPDFVFTLAQVASRAEDYSQAAEAYARFLQISPQADADRRARIKGLINFLKFLGERNKLYQLDGATETTVPFRLVNDRPVIELKINNRSEPLNFVLDTGSGISVISNETARRLKLKPVTRGGQARGVGGAGTFEIVYGFLRSANLGGVRVRNVPVYIREFHTKDERIDGYIGLAFISKFLTTIDYGDSTFVLKKKSSAGENAENTNASLPLRLTAGGFLSGEVQLDGVAKPLNFIVDTGASISVISSELADLKEINKFVSKDKIRVVGAAGITEEMPSFLLPKVSFGENSRESIKAVALDLSVINETTGFQQAGILGGNFLKNYRLTFDFNNSKVLFVPIK